MIQKHKNTQNYSSGNDIKSSANRRQTYDNKSTEIAQKYYFERVGKEISKIESTKIEDFEVIIEETKKMLMELGQFDKLTYEEDKEYLPIKKAMKKGTKVVTMYQDLYLDEISDNNYKIFICREYYEFKQQYTRVKSILNGGKKDA